MTVKKFTEDEMKCNCGCGLLIKNQHFIDKITAARIISGVPYKINSWCRCKNHNSDEGGKDDSAHLKGLAVDISTPTSYSRFHVYRGLIMAGFTRIGHGKDFIHADDDLTKPQRVVFDY